ncbi:MAG: PQQ-binding-like beta-propeller repeat protein [Candidatus Eremiobacteraeota bacterium]|nr:PQQ-binding-like beta-propeller repeat protein [Candidatus Eremiobacteraeota bacterium]
MRVPVCARTLAVVAIVVGGACSGASTPLFPSHAATAHRPRHAAQVDVYSETVLHDSPTAYYRLDDSGNTAADDSGNGLNGTVGGSVKEGAPGLLLTSSDTAMSFPGQASAAGTILVPSNSLLQPTSAVSLEAWLRFPSVPVNYTVPVAYGSDASYAPYDFYFSSGKLSAQFDLNTGVLVVTSPSSLQPNITYYAVSTFDGATARLYLNGVQVASVAKSGTIVNYQPKYGLAIGDDAGLSDPAFLGTADEVAVYAGSALSAAQVQSHYNAGTNPSATPPPTPTPPPPGVDWTTMGYDLARSGYNPNEKTIGIGSFGAFHKIWQKAIGGEIGEPALASNVLRGSQAVNILYAGGFDTGKLYALNAASGATLWSKRLATANYHCGSHTYRFGPAGAPVIDRATNRVYVPDGAARVHAFDLATGVEASGWPITIAAPANHNFIYGGLTYNPANGMLYAETSSTCDISPWYGRIVAISTANATIVGTFYPTQGQSGGGIWGFGGASVDASTNNVFILTGNADTSHGQMQNAYYAEQVVELSADVNTVIANNYPGLPQGAGDEDFGATPLLFTPPGCGPLLAAMNKSGMFFLYNRNAIGAGPTQAIQMSITTDNGDFVGVPAYDPLTNLVYVEQPATFGIYRPGVAAFSMRSDCTINPMPFWAAHFGADGSQSQSDTLRSPITVANGVLYISDYQTAQTFAFNAMTGSQLWTQPLSGYGVVGPIVVNGKLYVGSWGTYLTAWSP